MKYWKLAPLALTAALLAGCGGPAAPSAAPSAAGSAAPSAAVPTEPIKIATKPMTEQYILGSMLSQLIEATTPYKTVVTEGIGGGTSNIMPAMEKGEFDLYPEYTASGWVVVLKHAAGEIPDDEMLSALQTEYEENYQMTWVGLYGFNNTYTVAVTKETADKYDLKTCSDLARATSGLTLDNAPTSTDLVFGGNPDYLEREDGFKGMSTAYGFQFKDVKDVDIGLKYQALDSGDIDATNAYTTDAQLATGKYVALADDKGYQVNYYASTVVRQDALEKYPGLEETLKLMDGVLDDAAMAKLNAAVEIDGRDEKDVAHDFLVEKGLI